MDDWLRTSFRINGASYLSQNSNTTHRRTRMAPELFIAVAHKYRNGHRSLTGKVEDRVLYFFSLACQLVVGRMTTAGMKHVLSRVHLSLHFRIISFTDRIRPAMNQSINWRKFLGMRQWKILQIVRFWWFFYDFFLLKRSQMSPYYSISSQLIEFKRSDERTRPNNTQSLSLARITNSSRTYADKCVLWNQNLNRMIGIQNLNLQIARPSSCIAQLSTSQTVNVRREFATDYTISSGQRSFDAFIFAILCGAGLDISIKFSQ